MKYYIVCVKNRSGEITRLVTFNTHSQAKKALKEFQHNNHSDFFYIEISNDLYA